MLSGRVQAGLSGVHNGDQLGYNVRGTVNVPLSETWAVRASGFTRLDPGYIDNAQTGARGVNRGEAHGGRLSALWRPTGNLSVKLGALIQDITTDGWATVDLLPGLGELEQSTLRGTGGYQKKSEVYSATVTANVGRADLTAVSGYSVNTASDTLDLTPILSAVTDSIYGVTGTPSREHNETSKFTQEVRLALPIGEKVEWLLGAFYTDEDSEFVQHIQAADAGSGVVVGSVLLNSFPTAFKEYAAFTDVTVHLTDRFDVQVGGRESRNRQTYTDTLSGPLAGGTSVVPEVESKDSAFTYLVTPRFRVSPNLMIYARWASGYRAGGPNSVLPGSVLPRTFGPDTTQNYEIGVKGDLLARTLSFDASVYSIDWKDIQLLLNPTFGSYYANAGSARSQGIELSMEARPLASLTIAAWVAWNDAELTEDFPATSSVYGASGDRLPYSSRFSGNISLDQEFPLTGGATGFAGGTLSYTGARQDVFTASALQPRNVFPAYAKTDLHAGVKYEDWTASLFINNAADRRGVIASGLVPGTVGYVQPRTVGLALAKSF
jgi:outer membrane receptor protein involved in Fe transport